LDYVSVTVSALISAEPANQEGLTLLFRLSLCFGWWSSFKLKQQFKKNLNDCVDCLSIIASAAWPQNTRMLPKVPFMTDLG
jgi:hypothetical protein